MPSVFLERGDHFRTTHELWNVRRADFFFTLGDHHEVDRQLAPGALNRVKSGEKDGLRTLLVDRTATDDNFAETGLVDNCGIKRRRRPFRRIHLLHVVHEVDADGAGSAGVERCERCRAVRRSESL